MKKITVLGANPAFQKTLTFDGFRQGKVNRAKDVTFTASGKGINFCRAARCWGLVSTELIQFTGGANGDFILGELNKEGLAHLSTRTAAATRCCTTCLNGNDITEIIDPSGSASQEEADHLLADLRNSLQMACGFAVCGTLPGKTDPTLYERSVAAAGSNALILLDAYKNIDKLFAPNRKIVLKINRDELNWLTGIPDAEKALGTLFDRFPLYAAAITDGPDKAYAFDGKEFSVYELPELKVVNPIGSGDTASAVLLSELVSGRDLRQAFLMALSAASANCLTIRPGNFDKEQALHLAQNTKINS